MSNIERHGGPCCLRETCSAVSSEKSCHETRCRFHTMSRHTNRLIPSCDPKGSAPLATGSRLYRAASAFAGPPLFWAALVCAPPSGVAILGAAPSVSLRDTAGPLRTAIRPCGALASRVGLEAISRRSHVFWSRQPKRGVEAEGVDVRSTTARASAASPALPDGGEDSQAGRMARARRLRAQTNNANDSQQAVLR